MIKRAGVHVLRPSLSLKAIMITLGLDPSVSSYGWVVYDSERTGIDRVIERGRWKTSSKALEVARYIELRDNLRAKIREHGIQHAGMETPPVGTAAWSQEKLYALYIYNLEAMYLERVDVVLIAPTQLQLFAKVWGSGVVTGDWFKSDMQDTARVDMLELYDYPRHADYRHKSDTKQKRSRTAGMTTNPFPLVDVSTYPKGIRKHLRIQQDEADAYHAARFANRFWRHLSGGISEDDLTPSEWDLFAKTKTWQRGKKAGQTEELGIKYKEGARFFRFASGTQT